MNIARRIDSTTEAASVVLDRMPPGVTHSRVPGRGKTPGSEREVWSRVADRKDDRLRVADFDPFCQASEEDETIEEIRGLRVTWSACR